MQELENEKIFKKEKAVSVLSGKKLFYCLKKLFIPWIIAAAVIIA